jgi:hypothetical protein
MGDPDVSGNIWVHFASGKANEIKKERKKEFCSR